MPDTTPQTVRSQRWHAGIATRIDEIKAELEQLSSDAQVDHELAKMKAELGGGEDKKELGA